MRKNKKTRSIFWWIWPKFYFEKDAFDVSKTGVFCCAWIAASTGISHIISYSGNGNTGSLMSGVINALIYSLLGYGVLRMSRIAVSGAFIYFIIGIIWPFVERGKIGPAPIFIWYFLQSNRAVYWYRAGMAKAEIKLPNYLICPYCKTQDRTNHFSQGIEWLCPTCKRTFPKT